MLNCRRASARGTSRMELMRGKADRDRAGFLPRFERFSLPKGINLLGFEVPLQVWVRRPSIRREALPTAHARANLLDDAGKQTAWTSTRAHCVAARPALAVRARRPRTRGLKRRAARFARVRSGTTRVARHRPGANASERRRRKRRDLPVPTSRAHFFWRSFPGTRVLAPSRSRRAGEYVRDGGEDERRIRRRGASPAAKAHEGASRPRSPASIRLLASHRPAPPPPHILVRAKSASFRGVARRRRASWRVVPRDARFARLKNRAPNPKNASPRGDASRGRGYAPRAPSRLPPRARTPPRRAREAVSVRRA